MISIKKKGKNVLFRLFRLLDGRIFWDKYRFTTIKRYRESFNAIKQKIENYRLYNITPLCSHL